MYLFMRSGGTWRQTAYVKASNTEEFDKFGSALALDGSGGLLGARYEDGGEKGETRVPGNEPSPTVPDSGAVYLFLRRP